MLKYDAQIFYHHHPSSSQSSPGSCEFCLLVASSCVFLELAVSPRELSHPKLSLLPRDSPHSVTGPCGCTMARPSQFWVTLQHYPSSELCHPAVHTPHRCWSGIIPRWTPGTNLCLSSSSLETWHKLVHHRAQLWRARRVRTINSGY